MSSLRQVGLAVPTDEAVVGDAPGPARSLEQLRQQVELARVTAQRLMDASTDDRVTRPAVDAAALLAQALET